MSDEHPERGAADLFRGLANVIYFIEEDDLPRASEWYARLLGRPPYMARKKFVSFLVGEIELCLHRASDKARPGPDGQVAYWQVDDLGAAIQWFLDCGAVQYRRILQIPEGGFVVAFRDPFGNVIGIRERGEIAPDILD